LKADYLTYVLPIGINMMSNKAALMTTLSSKGQMVLPKALRDRQRWAPGAKLTLEEVPGGVLVKLIEAEQKYTVDDLIGIARYTGPPLSDEEIERRIDESFAEEFRAGKW
jgi:AbrB family looped-hinge helix DNA binding protein